MPITYTVDRERRLIFETWSGAVDRAELSRHWTVILHDPEVMAIRRTVVDMRAAQVRLGVHDLDGLIASLVVPVLGSRRWITAIIVDEPLQFGVSRQYQALAERYSRDAIFRTVDEAIAWITPQPVDG